MRTAITAPAATTTMTSSRLSMRNQGTRCACRVRQTRGDFMLRALFRLVLLVIVLFAVGALLLGYRWGSGSVGGDPVVGTTGERSSPTNDSSRAREAGAEVAGTLADG